MDARHPFDLTGASFELRYGAAIVAVLVAAAIRWALQPVMGAAPPYITFYVAIVVAAAAGGLGPGLFATVFGGLLGVGLANWPAQALSLASEAEQARLLIYLVSGAAISLIAEAMHRARSAAARHAQEVQAKSDELALANERLGEADRSKDRFLAVLAHELRNPLAPIKHSLYLLDRVPADSELARRARAVLERQTDQLGRLVNDLLDITRINHDKLDLQRSTLDLRVVVRRAVDDHQAMFTQKGIRLQVVVPERPAWVFGDAARLAQVLGNLLHNAMKFTPAGGVVDATLHEAQGQAVIRVRDTGSGIPPALIGRIFEPFTQSDQQLDRAAGGLGLGLTLVRKMVDLHGGSVDVRSEGTGRGSEFEIRLPLEAAPQGEGAPPPARPAAGPSWPRRVLLIEDNRDAADVLSQLLALGGHEVHLAHSGDEGVEKAAALHPDVVVCDIGLPGLDGYEVARRLRAHPATQRALLVALTGYATEDVRREVLRAGFDRHLVKPAAAQEVEAAIFGS